jgi:endonuclease III
LDDFVARLQAFYGVLPQPPRDPFALFVWEVLSVHAPPRKRDAAFAALKRIRALTPDAMSRAPKKALEDSVALAGPYLAQRLAALRTGIDCFRRSPTLATAIAGPLPAARRALRALPRMDEGAIHRMLLFAADRIVVPVDGAVARVACRFGLAQRHAEPAKTERSVRDAIARALPRDAAAYRQLVVYLTHHGATTCTESDPHCHVCPLATDCAAAISGVVDRTSDRRR